jgi:flagellar biosynthetic protein FliR
MDFFADDLLALVQGFMLPFVRLGAFFLVAPIFGAQNVPVRIRLLLSALVAYILYPALPPAPLLDALSGTGVALVMQEILIGIGMALVLQFVLAGIQMAGHAIANAMGLGFASSADPQNGIQVTIVGQFYVVLATLVFLAIDGHLHALDLLASSFLRFPAGTFVLASGFLWQVVLFSSQLFVTGLLVSLPVMTGVLLVNLAFGVMTRAAPQLNIFSIGFPMAMIAGFVLMILSLPVLLPLLDSAFEQGFDQLDLLLQ